MMASSDTLVKTTNLSKIYGKRVQVRALDGVNLNVRVGEMVAVMGPSGSGKSTLLNMLGALDVPTAGNVFVAGQDLSQIEDLDRFRSRSLGFVFQMHNLIPTLTAQENVEVPLRSRRMSGKERRRRAERMLTLVDLTERGDHLPNQLSGGQRQRVAIARALVNEPRLVLADEPTGNLDSQSGQEVIDLLRRLNREQNTTILVVTHDPLVARATERILSMSDGRIVDEHMVADPLTEDLRHLAHSEFGQRLMAGDLDALAQFPFVENGQLTELGQELARLLSEIA